jgi:DNA-directed RNA polymerase specialized sigma24 family protein
MGPSHPLNEKKLLRSVRYVLRRNGIPAMYLDDTVREIVVLTLEYLVGKEAPADENEWTALACRIARNHAISELRKRKTREKKYGDCGLTDQEDEVEPLPNDDYRDPIDQKRLIGILEDQFREGEMAADGEVILDAVAAGESHEVIAEELGITRAAVKHRLTRMRETFAERLEKEGLSHLKREKG